MKLFNINIFLSKMYLEFCKYQKYLLKYYFLLYYREELFMKSILFLKFEFHSYLIIFG